MTDTEIKITKHNWVIEEVANKGPKFYWVCRNCGSSGGPVWGKEDLEPSWEPFLAGTPLVNISNDCAKARNQIDEFIAMYPAWKGYADKARAKKEESV